MCVSRVVQTEKGGRERKGETADAIAEPEAVMVKLRHAAPAVMAMLRVHQLLHAAVRAVARIHGLSGRGLIHYAHALLVYMK